MRTARGDRVAAQPLQEGRTSDEDACLGTAEELVRRERDEVRPLVERVGDARLVVRMTVAMMQQSGSDIEQERDPELASETREIRRRRRRREAHHAVVGRVHLEDQSGLVPGRRPIVADPRPVGGADLGESGPGRREDVGDPELSADLDQFAARDEDLLAFGERGHRQQEGCGAVVHDHRRLRSGERGEQDLGVATALAAAAGLSIDLDVGVVAGGARRRSRCALGQRRAPQVRVQDDPGSVDDRHHPLRRMRRSAERPRQQDLLGRRILALGRGRSHLLEHVFEHPFQERTSERGSGPPRRVRAQERIHRGDLPADVDGHRPGAYRLG